jgi:hypothetical protein
MPVAEAYRPGRPKPTTAADPDRRQPVPPAQYLRDREVCRY